MKRLLIFSLALTSAAAFAQTTYGPGAGGIVPDAVTTTPGVFTSTINVGTGITSVNWVEIQNFRHTWAGDINITLTAPGGAMVTLYDRFGVPGSTFGDSSNFGSDGSGSTFDTLTGRTYRFQVGGADLLAALTAATGAQGVAAGTYAPTAADDSATNFSAFNNVGAGVWTLTVTDFAEGDTGDVGSWTFNANPVPEPATMAALGLGALALIRRRRKA